MPKQDWVFCSSAQPLPLHDYSLKQAWFSTKTWISDTSLISKGNRQKNYQARYMHEKRREYTHDGFLFGLLLFCFNNVFLVFGCGLFFRSIFKVESTSKLFSTHQERSASLFKMKLLYLGVKWSQQIQSTNRNVWHFLLLPFINQLCLILPCSTTWEIIGDSYQQKTFPWSKEPENTC